MIYAAGGFGVAMALLTASPTLAAAIAAAGLVGAASIGFLTTGNATIQLAAPPQMRGRVTALWTTAFVGSTPVGAVLIGMVAHSYGDVQHWASASPDAAPPPALACSYIGPCPNRRRGSRHLGVDGIVLVAATKLVMARSLRNGWWQGRRPRQ